MRIKRVGLWSFTKLVTVLSVVYGAFCGLCYGWLGHALRAGWNLGAGVPASEAYATQWAMVGGTALSGALMGAAWGLLGGPLLGLVLNVSLSVTRGLELEVEASESEALAPDRALGSAARKLPRPRAAPSKPTRP